MLSKTRTFFLIAVLTLVGFNTAFAQEQNIPLRVIQTQEMEKPEYTRNDASRCFHCKDELFAVMSNFAESEGFQAIAYGVNVDDQGDFRPGQQAARNHGVSAPLLEAGLSKISLN